MKTIHFANGMAIELRPLTEEEFLVMQDKKISLLTPGLVVRDLLDDGDEEILNCVVSPDRAEMEKFLKRYARASDHLRRELMLMAGEGIDCHLDESVEDDLSLKAKYNEEIIGVLVDGVTLGLRRLTRLESKVLDRESAERKFISHRSFSKLGHSHVLPEYAEKAAQLFEKYPVLPANLGAFLVRASSGELEQFAKKLSPSTKMQTKTSMLQPEILPPSIMAESTKQN